MTSAARWRQARVEGAPAGGIVNDPAVELTAESILALDQAADEADVTTGWHAIEFLLWGQDLSATGPGARPVSDFLAGQGNNDRRRLYLQTVTAMLADDLDALAAAWAADGGLPRRAARGARRAGRRAG